MSKSNEFKKMNVLVVSVKVGLVQTWLEQKPLWFDAGA
jgi:hypothetical protein